MKWILSLCQNAAEIVIHIGSQHFTTWQPSAVTLAAPDVELHFQPESAKDQTFEHWPLVLPDVEYEGVKRSKIKDQGRNPKEKPLPAQGF